MRILALLSFALVTGLVFPGSAPAQRPPENVKQRVRTVSIPISIYTKEELRADQAEEFVRVERLVLKEDREDQEILSIRSVEVAPLSLAILVQEDLVSQFNLQLKDLGTFIRNLPKGTRVMVAYLRGGSLDVRQRFTDDLGKAADSLRILSSTASSAPRNPYDALIDAMNRFDALPAGRRAVLMISDGLDVSLGLSSSSPT